MKVGLYAVLDSCSGVYDGPVPAHNDEVALRNFTHMCRNPDSPIAKNPEHFSLWQLGGYNDATGEIEPEIKQCLAYAIDLIIKEKEIN